MPYWTPFFIIVFRWGLQGAPRATAIGQCVGGISPAALISPANTSLLLAYEREIRLGTALLKVCRQRPRADEQHIRSIVSMLYNIQLVKNTPERRRAAYGVLMYVNMIFLAAFIGFS